MRYHFISIGGSAMHSLALALHDSGHVITGSDDAIHEPAKGNLERAGLLPTALGWHPDRITPDLDGVILGMHAGEQNPELVHAKELGLKVWSFPEFIRQHADQKQRVVIAGSHGKSTVTAMAMHVLNKLGIHFDYLVGAQVPGFERTVRLTDNAPFILLEGDEYPASPLDPRAKFMVYEPHTVLITGIAWDHMNIYKSEEAYLKPFEQLLRELPKGAMLVYNKGQKAVRELVKNIVSNDHYFCYPFDALVYRVKAGQMYIRIPVDKEVARKLALEAMRKLKRPRTLFPVKVYGEHNMMNISAALELCRIFAIEPDEFLDAIADFEGAGLRLQTYRETSRTVLIRDFAHAPSKVDASVSAVREKYAAHNITAVLELHTYSSLNKEFLPQFRGTLKKADQRIIYLDPQAAERKNLIPPTVDEIRQGFGEKDIVVVTNKERLAELLYTSLKPTKNALLLMSSGNLGGLDLDALTI
jgi:UDP-N-acetylmuramate: L-alanyl-gamma-D-glutamyl-meso-diaminopimelate ligase